MQELVGDNATKAEMPSQPHESITVEYTQDPVHALRHLCMEAPTHRLNKSVGVGCHPVYKYALQTTANFIALCCSS